MIALDTNVVVRFLVNDDEHQAQRARALIEQNPVQLLPTVLLETEWVLRAAYGFSAKRIAEFFKALLGLEQCIAAATAAVAEALDCYESGMDFADALHLSLSGNADSIATFDHKLINQAGMAGKPVVEP